MTKVLTANLLFLNQTIYIVCEGFQKNQFIDTHGNVWQSDEITVTGWTLLDIPDYKNIFNLRDSVQWHGVPNE